MMINKDQLLSFYGNDAESAIQITIQVKESIPEVLNDLELALATNNIKELNAKLHFHAPTFGYVGLDEITSAMRGAELRCLDAQNTLEIEPEIFALKSMIKDGNVQLSNLINDLKLTA